MSSNTATSWIPGASDYLGSGINVFGNYFKPELKPSFLDFTPYDLPTAQWSDQTVPGTTNVFRLPASIAYSNIPSSHGQTIVAESKMKMSEELSTRANAKVSYGGFTATVKASYKNFSDSEEDRWYCLTDGSQKVYSLSARNIDQTMIHRQVRTRDTYNNLLKLLKEATRCNSTTEETYFAFFDFYGTHVITGVEMGGGLHIFTSMAKTYAKSAHEVQASATAEYTGVFEGGGDADWKKTNATWLTNRSGSIDAYGGDSGSPLLAKIMSGVLPATDLSGDMATWASSVPKNPAMVDFTVTNIAQLFETKQYRDLVSEAYDRYAESYVHLSFAVGTLSGDGENIMEWRRRPVPFTATRPHGVTLGPPRFQGWCVINRTTGEVESVIPFATKTSDQQVPAELKDPERYNNDNHLLLFAHWEGAGNDTHWRERPFNNEVAAFLRRCGGGRILQDYNSTETQVPANPYSIGFYVLCGVIGSGGGQGREFTNIYPGAAVRNVDIILPLIPERTGGVFRLSLLNLG